MKHTYLFLTMMFLLFTVSAQTNIAMTNPTADAIVKGNYDPSLYSAVSHDDHHFVLCDLNNRVDADSLKSYLETLQSFRTRHTYSDTTSADTGIGAARRWAFQKFKDFSSRNNGRLISSYLEFDQPTGGSCGPGFGWRNILAVLPGSDTSDHSNIVIEAHIDSRCEGSCDANCFAPGVDDNGSGTALVLELARVMSMYTFDHTLIFMLTIGEEQGLLGSGAMSKYCTDNNIPVKGALNNDIVGGIICGQTASPPGCPFPGHVDSMQLKLFSNGNPNFAYRSFARTIKMYYDEKLKDEVKVPMTVTIMNQEDRTGRGGDHIPFRIDGYRNVRFTSANEHGDAGIGPGYTDRQHTSTDILGIDTNGDQALDKYFVDFNYLARNTVINGIAATLLALGPETPEFVLHDEPEGLRVEITNPENYKEYRIGVRDQSLFNLEYEALYRTSDTSFRIPGLNAGESYYISIAGIDSSNIMSPFSNEVLGSQDDTTEAGVQDNLPYKVSCSTVGIGIDPSSSVNRLILRVYPNPGSGDFAIDISHAGTLIGKQSVIVIYDLSGNEIARQNSYIKNGKSILTPGGHLSSGSYLMSCIVNGKVVGNARFVVMD